jgi:hypothetical protein
MRRRLGFWIQRAVAPRVYAFGQWVARGEDALADFHAERELEAAV